MEMMKYIGAILLLVTWIECSTLSTTLTLIEQQVIARKLNEPPKDLSSLYYAATALNAIEKEVENKDEMCKFAGEKLKADNAQSLMQYSFIAKILECKDIPTLKIETLVTDGIELMNFANLIIAMGNLGIKIEDAVVKKFVAMAKDNDTPSAAAASFMASSFLPKDNPDVKPIVSMVEDLLAQADEINNEYLQYEGGLALTSKVINGIIALGDKQEKKFLNEKQAIKFAKYFLSRKYVHSLKDIHHLLIVLSALSNNKQLVPVVVSTFRSNVITQDNPSLKVRVTNLIDQAIPNVTITATSFETAGSDATAILENTALESSKDAEDFIVVDSENVKGFIAANAFKLDVMSAKPSRGVYNGNFKVSHENKLFAAGSAFTLSFKIVTKISIEDVEIGVGDKDHSAIAKSTQVQFPEKMSKVLEADHHQKLVMTFKLKDVNKEELVTVHQAFIRLVHQVSGQEIFFVAEPDSNDLYKFTLDVGATAKDSFNYLSGKYGISLIIGDVAIQNPLAWSLGDVSITFSGQPKKSKREARITEPKPIIEHMFRIPDKRPSKLVSTAFTVLVVSPLLVMFAVWANAGANISNLQLTVPTIAFHIGLACIFGLYYMFWVKFDMFYTLKLLVLIGGSTFLGGNKMLADMAAARYSKS